MARSNVMSLFDVLDTLPGQEELLLTSNVALLDEYAKPLRAVGVNRIHISSDRLGADRFKRISRVGKLDKVLQGIDGAIEAGFEQIKLNSLMMNGYNESVIIALADDAIERDIDIALIEEMPLGVVSERDRQKTTRVLHGPKN
jgi:cyclic pyranopterin phosphate synthase